jgi:hypothetical protein
MTSAADRLLYTTTGGGPSAITSLLLGRGTSEEVIPRVHFSRRDVGWPNDPAYGHLVAINVNTGAETVLGDNLIEGSSDAPGWSIAIAADGHSFIASLSAGQTEPQQLLRIQVPAAESRSSPTI